MIATTFGTVAGATVGRIPIVGVPLSMAARQIVRDELKNVKFFDKEQSPEKANNEEVFFVTESTVGIQIWDESK